MNEWSNVRIRLLDDGSLLLTAEREGVPHAWESLDEGRTWVALGG
jgi:hypothetical protein